MSVESCLKNAKNRVSYVCLRAAELRKGKSVQTMSQSEAFVKANKEAIRLQKEGKL